MTVRNLSPQQMFIALAQEHHPLYKFEGQTPKDFTAWKQTALPKVLATLGDFPTSVPPNPQLLAEWTDKGLRRQRWIIDVQPYLTATLLINIPPELSETETHPAILCCHGHGPYGKEPVMGNASSPELHQEIQP